ncbi:MAG: hypothetical protein SGI87_14575, partial [Flavobacteriales bacterium]|nr:hypothetical protein [Flavobacteriales bacterium]
MKNTRHFYQFEYNLQKIKYLVFSVVTIALQLPNTWLHSQVVCGNHLNYPQQTSDPNCINQRINTGTNFQTWKSQYGSGTTEEYIIPEAVHVIRTNGPENISDDQIVTALTQNPHWKSIAALTLFDIKHFLDFY